MDNLRLALANGTRQEARKRQLEEALSIGMDTHTHAGAGLNGLAALKQQAGLHILPLATNQRLAGPAASSLFNFGSSTQRPSLLSPNTNTNATAATYTASQLWKKDLVGLVGGQPPLGRPISLLYPPKQRTTTPTNGEIAALFNARLDAIAKEQDSTKRAMAVLLTRQDTREDATSHATATAVVPGATARDKALSRAVLSLSSRPEGLLPSSTLLGLLDTPQTETLPYDLLHSHDTSRAVLQMLHQAKAPPCPFPETKVDCEEHIRKKPKVMEATMRYDDDTSSSTTFPLGIEEDQNWLSELQCILRADLVEVFQKDDSSKAMNGRKAIASQQIGIRCRWCATMSPDSKVCRSTAYPSSIRQVRPYCTLV